MAGYGVDALSMIGTHDTLLLETWVEHDPMPDNNHVAPQHIQLQPIHMHIRTNYLLGIFQYQFLA